MRVYTVLYDLFLHALDGRMCSTDLEMHTTSTTISVLRHTWPLPRRDPDTLVWARVISVSRSLSISPPQSDLATTDDQNLSVSIIAGRDWLAKRPRPVIAVSDCIQPFCLSLVVLLLDGPVCLFVILDTYSTCCIQVGDLCQPYTTQPASSGPVVPPRLQCTGVAECIVRIAARKDRAEKERERRKVSDYVSRFPAGPRSTCCLAWRWIS